MHLLLERKEMADLVITDLARWKDWSIQDRLMTMYSDENYDIPAIRRAIVRYLYYCSQEKLNPPPMARGQQRKMPSKQKPT